MPPISALEDVGALWLNTLQRAMGRASHDVKFGAGKDARTMTLGLDGFNLLNRVNYGSYVGTVNSSLFGLPVSARPPRQLQFSARLKF